jgi:carbon-monoxide dehydrogenase large subunit
MEGRACITDYDPATGVLTLYSATQMPHLLRTGLADTLAWANMPSGHRDVGGGFGIKSHLFPKSRSLPAVDAPGASVKWIEDTTEHLAASIHAREHVHRVQMASCDGTVLGIKADVLVDAGAYSVWPWTAAMEVGMAVNMIRGHIASAPTFRARTVATNKCPLGPYRGVARSSAAFTIERAMDEIARELGLDRWRSGSELRPGRCLSVHIHYRLYLRQRQPPGLPAEAHRGDRLRRLPL